MSSLPPDVGGAGSWVEVAVTDLYTQPGSQGQVCEIRRSERLARLEESASALLRRSTVEAVHSEVLQDLFAVALELDRSLTHASPSSVARDRCRSGRRGASHGTLREVVKP